MCVRVLVFVYEIACTKFCCFCDYNFKNIYVIKQMEYSIKILFHHIFFISGAEMRYKQQTDIGVNLKNLLFL